MPVKASEMNRRSNPRSITAAQTSRYPRLENGSKSCTDLRSQHERDSARKRESILYVTNPDVFDGAHPVANERERPPSCLRRSSSSMDHSTSPKPVKRVRIVENNPESRHSSQQSDEHSEPPYHPEAPRHSRSGSVPGLSSPTARPSSSAINVVRHENVSPPRARTNSAPTKVRRKDVLQVNDWLESSSDELKKFLCPTPPTSPDNTPPRPARSEPPRPPADKDATVVRLTSRPLSPLQLNIPSLNLMDTPPHISDVNFASDPRPAPRPVAATTQRPSTTPPPRPARSTPPRNRQSTARTDSSAGSSSEGSSSSDFFMPSKSSHSSVPSQDRIPPLPPKSSADLWRPLPPRSITLPTPSQRPTLHGANSAPTPGNKGLKKSKSIARLFSSLNLGSRGVEKPPERCNCGSKTINLHYKRFHTSEGDGFGLL